MGNAGKFEINQIESFKWRSDRLRQAET